MQEKVTPEEKKIIREFKAKLFDSYWEKFGTFYLHIIPHPNLEIGKRGLVGEEKEAGIVLVFGPQAVKELKAEADYLYVELQFGFAWEKLIIPWDAIFRIYDKAQHCITQMRTFEDEITFEPFKEKPKPKPPESKVIQVDFGKDK
ncbi:MAG: ClpXP protease specificity-enhancing factor SspB [Spirochaetota bacterium]